jgi:hypothetical protein
MDAPEPTAPDSPESDVVPVEEDRRIGRTLGNLEVVDRIGIGGMGAVYRALHRVLETPYAVKVLHPRFSEDPDAVERFRSEAVAASRLRHPNVVFVTDFGFDDEVGLYIVMEHLEGVTLKQLIRRKGALTVGRMARIADQLCSGMAAAHRLEIVHRDLKPENVIVLSDVARRDHVKVLDFGIARLRDQAEEEETEVLGTPQYMAPEQIAGSAAAGKPTVDIYALGMVFYAMLTGEPAFDGPDHVRILEAQLRDTPAPVSRANPALAGSELEALIMEMLAKQPEKRPQRLEDVQERLAAAVAALVEEGVAGSSYVPPTEPEDLTKSDATAVWTGAVSGTIRMTAVLKQIRAVDPKSAAAVLLDAMPSLETIRGEALCLALWGVIQQELLEHEPGTAAFELGSDQLVLLLQAVLESHDGSNASSAQKKVFRAVRSTLPIFDDARRDAILRALRPLSANPLFPADLTETQHAGSWHAFKKVMTTEIHMPWRREKGEKPPPKPSKAAPAKEELARMSLMQKLKQDVSVASIGALLTHEIKLFGGNTEDAVKALPAPPAPAPEDDVEEAEELPTDVAMQAVPDALPTDVGLAPIPDALPTDVALAPVDEDAFPPLPDDLDTDIEIVPILPEEAPLPGEDDEDVDDEPTVT